MTIGELIKDRDYVYINYRITLPEKAGGGDTFAGIIRSENGKLISLDGDTYSLDEEVLSYEEWKHNDMDCITVVVDGCWEE